MEGEGERETTEGAEKEGESTTRSDDELNSGGSLTKIIAPPESFSGDDSATPTPQLEIESSGRGSGTLTPRTPPGQLSPTVYSPSGLEDDTHIDMAELEASGGEPPLAKQGAGAKVLTVIASTGEEEVEEGSLQSGQSSSLQSFTLKSFRPSSVTSNESDRSVQGLPPEHGHDFEEEGTDM